MCAWTARACNAFTRFIPILKIVLFTVFFIPSLHGKVLRNEVVGKSRQFSKVKDVCKSLGHKHLLMVSTVENHSVDCMGKTEKITKFCEKKYPKKKGLLRGIIDPVEKDKVICEFGENVRLKISCTDRHKKLCFVPHKSCKSLRKFYALRLSVIRSSTSANTLLCLYGE